MTPRDIITGLRAAGFWPRLPTDGHEFIPTLPAPGTRINLLAAIEIDADLTAQHEACIAFLRSELQPWQPARCVVGDELDELLADAWPDADPPMREILRIPLETAAIAESARLSLRMRISSARLPPRQNYPGKP